MSGSRFHLPNQNDSKGFRERKLGGYTHPPADRNDEAALSRRTSIFGRRQAIPSMRIGDIAKGHSENLRQIAVAMNAVIAVLG